MFRFTGHAVTKFRKFYREKIYNERRKAKKYVPCVWSFVDRRPANSHNFLLFSRDRNEVRHLLRRFPKVSKDLLAKKYPHVDIKKILRNDEARGHFLPQ